MRQTFLKLVVSCLMLLTFISISHGQTTVNPGANTLSDAIAAASAGDVLELSGGEYTESDSIIIDKNLTIKAAAGLTVKPVLKTDNAIFIILKSDLTLIGLDIDGQTATHKFIFNDPLDENNLTITDCKIHDFQSPVDPADPYVIHVDDGQFGFDNLIIDNCLFENVSSDDDSPRGYFLYLEWDENVPDKAGVRNLSVTNSTFNHTAAYGIRAEGYHTDNTTDKALFVLDHLTLANSTKSTILRFRNITGSISNSIIAHLGEEAIETDNGAIVNIDYTDIFDWIGDKYDIGSDTEINEGAGMLFVDPMFADAANGDYTLGATSALRTAGSDGGAIGDPRWVGASSGGNTIVNPGANTLSDAITSASAGDILVLSGGEYTESDSIIIEKNLTIKAAAGLPKKPVLKTANATFMVLKSDLILEGLDFDGQANIATNTGIAIFNAPPDNNNLTITGCIFHDFDGTTGTKADENNVGITRIIYGSGDHPGFDSLKIDNCIFRDADVDGDNGYAVYLRAINSQVGAKYAEFTNSTFSKISTTGIWLGGYIETNQVDTAHFLIDHLTFTSSKTGVRLHNISGSITNCIFADIFVVAIKTARSSVINIDYLNFFNVVSDWKTTDESEIFIGDNILRLNPQFADPANGDYTLNTSSPLLTVGSDGGSIGDPRWDLSNNAGKFGLKTTVIGQGSINLDSFSGWYDSLEVATVTAIPEPGWVFDSWSGDANGSENPLTVTMDGDKNIIATFSLRSNVIYYTGFESGVLDTIAWTTKTSAAEGRIQVTTDYGPHSGDYHLTMDTDTTTSSKVTNEAWLHLDLSGKSQVNLNFWWHDYKEANDEFVDGIFFSDDGGVTFEQVLSLIDGLDSYQEINLDVDSLASANSLNLTNNFIIKFQQHEDHSIPNDGFGFDDITVIAETLDDIAENKTGEKVRQYVLHQNYPNPFNPVTNIKFDLPENGMVKLNIYNILGQKILELVNRELDAGQHNYSFDAGNLPSGVYVYKLETKNYNQTRKMILMK